MFEAPVKSGHAGPSEPSISQGIGTVPSSEPANVETPRHPTAQMTTYELRDYRRQLESAITFFDKQDPVPSARGHLQARLDAVLAEQESRTRLADAR